MTSAIVYRLILISGFMLLQVISRSHAFLGLADRRNSFQSAKIRLLYLSAGPVSPSPSHGPVEASHVGNSLNLVPCSLCHATRAIIVLISAPHNDVAVRRRDVHKMEWSSWQPAACYLAGESEIDASHKVVVREQEARLHRSLCPARRPWEEKKRSRRCVRVHRQRRPRCSIVVLLPPA